MTMTPLKLAMIALGLLAIVAGSYMSEHGGNPMVAVLLGTVGGKLLGLIFPEVGAKKDPPSGGGLGKDAAEPDVDVTPTDPPAAMSVWRNKWPIVGCCVALYLAGCSVLNRENARTAQDIAHDLCVMHFKQEKPKLSVEDVARTYCQDIDPWLDSILGAERLGAAKAKAKEAPAP